MNIIAKTTRGYIENIHFMRVISMIMLWIICVVLLINIYLQYEMNESNWCEAEVDILRKQISEIHTQVVKD
jgi:competence protein ComGC